MSTPHMASSHVVSRQLGDVKQRRPLTTACPMAARSKSCRRPPSPVRRSGSAVANRRSLIDLALLSKRLAHACLHAADVRTIASERQGSRMRASGKRSSAAQLCRSSPKRSRHRRRSLASGWLRCCLS